MNDINTRFKKLRIECKKSQEEWGDIIGVAKSGVSNIESGRREVNEKHLFKLSNWPERNINIEWLRTGKGSMFEQTPTTALGELKKKYNMSDFEVRIFEKYFSLSEEKRKFFREFIYDIVVEEQENESAAEFKTRFIQYYQRLASAGTGEVIFSDMPDDRIEIPDIPEYRRVAYAISVNGRSMEPLYEDGDMLLVEPTCSINVGEIGIFNVDGKAYVKKLGVGELISLNKEYKNIPITSESICMGRVIDKYNVK